MRILLWLKRPEYPIIVLEKSRISDYFYSDIRFEIYRALPSFLTCNTRHWWQNKPSCAKVTQSRPQHKFCCIPEL